MELLKQRILAEGKNLGRGILKINGFLATGRTIDALCRIVHSAGAELVGIAALVEKTFEGGRDVLANWGVPIYAAATITDMNNGQIVLA